MSGIGMPSGADNYTNISTINWHWYFHWLVTVGLDFVFLDGADRPYYCRKWGNELWLFYWHNIQQSWVSFGEVAEDQAAMFPHNLSPSEQKHYHDLHVQWKINQSLIGKVSE